MSIPAESYVSDLTETRTKPNLSLFMPTSRATADTRQDKIRFKNLLKEADRQLLKAGLRSSQAQDFLEPCRKLLADSVFWLNQSDGLAVFLNAGLFDCHRLPLHFDEVVVVGDRFHIKPLLPLFAGKGRFFILALSLKENRLFECSRFTVHEVDLKAKVPANLSSALKSPHPVNQMQFHTGQAGARIDHGAIFQGHGIGRDDTTNDQVHYFRLIDRGLREFLGNGSAPLAVACVDRLMPVYRLVNTYPHLVEEEIPGNPELLSGEELHKRAWPLVGPILLKAREEAAARYVRLAATDKVSGDLRQVVPAAYKGRVDVLFIPARACQWGAFDPESLEVDLHTDMKHSTSTASMDLLDFTAAQTLAHGGTVYPVEKEYLPDRSLVAALFRY